MNFKKDIRFPKKNFSYRFTVVLLIPIIIISLFTYISNVYYTRHYRSTLLSMCSNELNRFLQSTEDKLTEIYNSFSTFSSSPELEKLTDPYLTYDSITPLTLKNFQTSLLRTKTQMPELDSIILVNRSGNFVFSTNGVYDLSYFFDKVYKYSDYPSEFWLNYKFSGKSNNYLDSTNVFQYEFDDDYHIVPVVFNIIGSESGSFVIYNINAESIYEDFMTHQFTNNSQFYMINNDTGRALPNFYSTPTPILSQIEKISATSYYQVGSLNSEKKDYFILSSQKRSNTFGYSYVVQIPYSDIESQIHQLMSNVLLTGGLLALAMLIYLYLGSKNLSKPWLSLAKRLSSHESTINTSWNMINDIDSAITNLIDKNTDLTYNLSVSLPISQQKYIADIFNNSSFIPDDNMNKLIFKYSYFTVIAINISPNSIHNTNDAFTLNNNLYNEVYRALETVFAANFLTFSFYGTNNILYLILNTNSNNCSKEINEVNEQINQLLMADFQYIDISLGIGNTYKGIEGLKTSQHEASVEIIKNMNKNKVQIFDSNNLNDYSLSLYNENILINYMLTGHGESAVEFVKDIFVSCEKKHPQIKTQIYTDLFKALYKSIKIKKVRIPNFQAKSEHEIIEDLLCHTDEEILTCIVDIITNVTNLKDAAVKASASTIVEYIHDNYAQDLYLDGLAEKFNTTPKYLSKMLKQHLGIPFKTYLTQLRISKAEEMLLDKNIKINDISKNVGFFNQSSFIRAFKQKNGISPSEYRTLHTFRDK